MNTPVKRANSTALGKTCMPSRGPTKHEIGLFNWKEPKGGYQVPKRILISL